MVRHLEHVQARQPSGDEDRVHVVLRVAREQESPPLSLAEEDHRGVVDPPAAVGRFGRHGPGVRPQDGQQDLVEPDPGAGREGAACGAVPQGRVPRDPAGAGAAHAGFVDLPDAVPLQHPDQACDVVLVRMGQHQHVDPAVPRRDAGVQLEQEPVRVRPAVDEHPGPAPALEQDGIPLADVEHHETGRAGRGIPEREGRDPDDHRGRDDDAALGRRQALAGAPASARGGLRRCGRLPRPGPSRADPPQDGRDREDRDRRDGPGRSRDPRRQGHGGERQPGPQPDDRDDHVQHEPARQAGDHRDDRRRPEGDQPAREHRDDAAGHRDRHQGHDREVHGR